MLDRRAAGAFERAEGFILSGEFVPENQANLIRTSVVCV
jgi:hypothetical protein